MTKLTNLKISKLTKPGRYSDGAGLYLSVKDGSKSWLFRFKLAGRETWMGLGPLADLNLTEAREKARECRRLVSEGQSPLDARKAAAAALSEQHSYSFQALAERYIAAQKPGWKNAKHGNQWLNTLAAYAFPVIGQKPASIVTVHDVLTILEPIWTAKPETASRVRGRIETVLDYAAARKLRSAENPARWRGNLEHMLATRSKLARVEHHAAIPYADLPALMETLAARRGQAPRCVRFLVLTAARSGEARGATWSEIDMEAAIWTIPAERMKAGQMHRVPLSEPAMEVLRSIGHGEPGRLVFPGLTPGKSLSDVALTKALRVVAGEGFTIHGMRSAFRDWCAEQTAYANEIAESALAHTNRNKVEAAYLRSDHFEKRRRLMNEWGSYTTTPIKPKEQTKNIIPIRQSL